MQQEVLNGDFDIDCGIVPSIKDASRRNVVDWMNEYFKHNCDVMHTTGRLHLSDNYK